MAVNEDYLQYIQDQLSDFGDYETKKMFGGIGFFRDGIMFGLIGHGIFHLKANETNKAQFEELGSKAFLSDIKKKGMPYWAVPEEVLNDRDKLTRWAIQSFEVALSSKK